MEISNISEDLWHIGVSEDHLHLFENQALTENGIMYSTYILDAGGAYILIGSIPERYTADWIRAIKETVGTAAVSTAVFFGTDDDRSSAQAVLNEYPELQIIAGANAIFKLKDYVGRDFHSVEIRSARTLGIGSTRILFQPLQDKTASPCLYVCDRQRGYLFSANAFGEIGSFSEAVINADRNNEYALEAVKLFRCGVIESIDNKSDYSVNTLISDQKISMICPAYGPAVKGSSDDLIGFFEVIQAEKKENVRLAIAYEPVGFTREIAEKIAAGVSEEGSVRPDLIELSSVSRTEAIERLKDADAFLFGGTQLHGDINKGIWDILTTLRKGNLKDKPVSIFGSMNAECDAAQNLRQRLQQLGTAPVDRGFMIPGKPAERDLRNAYEYGYNFRCIIEKKTNTRRAHLVKCLVCGEIFDSSLGVCPVCGADLSFCVPVDEDEITFQKPTLLNYLILGGGVAAVNAADAIRLRDSSAGIVMISAEPHLPINRPMLTKNMEVLEDPDTLLLIHDRKWYDDRKIRTILGVRAIQIDTERKEVILSDDRIFSYDKLIYAVGSESFIPPFSGADQKGVITIRHIPDAVLLQKKLMTAQNVVVIGGGVLGLEAAYQIYRTGVHLTVLEATPQFVGRQVDEKTAGLIQSKMESMGVVCRTAVKIAAIEGSGQVTGVRLDDGTVFPADIVVISCGSHASVELAKAAGLAVDRAVVVDKTMQTSINGIYACGDCAQYNGISYQLWSEAAEQGKTAGANAAGDYVEYPGVPAGLSMEAFTISLFSIGDVGKKAGLTYKKVEISDEITGRHECYWFSENILRGAAVIGSPDKTGDIQNAVMTHKHYQESGTLI